MGAVFVYVSIPLIIFLEVNILDRRIHLDFITGAVLILLSLYVLGESIRMHGEVGGPFYASPGMLPTVLGTFLLITALLLFKRSIKLNTLLGNIREIKTWIKESSETQSIKEMLIGMAILAVYVFILAPTFPFWISSLIFLVFCMGALNATSMPKILAISALTVGSIVLLFQVIFHVPLP